MKLDGKTKLTGLLGHPVSHSVSPLMHNEAFRILGLNYCYLCFDVEEADMPAAIAGIKKLGLRGFNCTMPDKQIMATLCDHLSPAAKLIGAVNTVVNDDGVLTGYNTDGIGYMRSVSDSGFNIIGSTMTILGVGGAATSIIVQAALDGVDTIHMFCRKGRSYPKAETLEKTLNAETNCHVFLHEYSDLLALQSCVNQSQILVNATNIGMLPDNNDPLDASIQLHKDLIVSDIIYNPRETPLLKRAKQFGCPTMNGMYMLLYQGAEAFRLWTGVQMPVEHIKELYFNE